MKEGASWESSRSWWALGSCPEGNGGGTEPAVIKARVECREVGVSWEEIKVGSETNFRK